MSDHPTSLAALNLYVGAIDPRLPASTSVIVADRIYLSAFKVDDAVTVTTAKVEVAVASGNFDIGIYNASGTKLGSTGSTAVPAAGVGSTALLASVDLDPGVRYWQAIMADNATAAIYFWNGANIAIMSALAVQAFVNTTFPLPASITIPTNSVNNARGYGVWFTT